MVKEIFGKKVGMTQIFDEIGDLTGVTLVEIEPVCVLEEVERPQGKMVRIGCFKVAANRTQKVKKPLQGYFKKLNTDFYKLVEEVEPQAGADFSFLVGSQAKEQPAASTPEATEKKEEPKRNRRQIGVEIFSDGDVIDVRAKTKGRGFAGGMKRHGWSGQPSSHGSTTHRRIGAIGAHTFPGRVVRGHRMPGHMGNAFRTTKNLKVIKVDPDNNLLFVKGSIPGARGTVVKIKRVTAGAAQAKK